MKRLLAVSLMAAKGAFALTLGTLATICLLYIMQALIESGQPVITRVANVKMVEMLRIKEPQRVEIKKRQPVRPPPPDELPPAPQPEVFTQTADAVNSFQMSSVEVDHTLGIGRVQYSVTDSEYLPIVKVMPAYPVQAAAKDLVGWVIVEYTVTSHGTIRDPVVIANCAIASPNEPERECEDRPNSVFNEAAIRAALKFKYAPKTIDGVPIDTEGVRNYFSFQFDD